MVKQLDYDNVDWSQLFYYDTSSKSCLKWNTNRYSGKNSNILMARKGQDAGGLSKQQSGQPAGWTVEITSSGKRKSYRAHRIVAALHGVKVNDWVIDHVDGNPLNNHIDNIKVTTQAINTRNKKVRSNSPYGITGVTFRRIGKSDEFITRYVLKGKEKQKSFSIQRLGLMEAFKQAVLYRQRVIIELNKQGSEYSTRHTFISTASDDYSTYTEYKEKPFIKATNTSGVTGVRFYTNNYNNLYAQATWVENGKPKSKAFSTKVHGILPAFAMAFKYRTEVLEKLCKE